MNYRINRINSEMQKCISQIIRNKVKDPRVCSEVSVLEVSASKDLASAKVIVSIYGSDTEGTFEALKNSAGFIRAALAAEFKDLRTVPQLSFILDKSAEYGKHIDDILNSLKKDK